MGHTALHRVPCVPYFPRPDCLCSSAGVAALEFPGCAAHTLAHPLPPASLAEVLNGHRKKRHIGCESLMKTSHFSPHRGYRGIAVCAILLALAIFSWAESTPPQRGNDP